MGEGVHNWEKYFIGLFYVFESFPKGTLVYSEGVNVFPTALLLWSVATAKHNLKLENNESHNILFSLVGI